MRNQKKTITLLFLCVSIIISANILSVKPDSGNNYSAYAEIESIGERNTFDIKTSKYFGTIDKAYINGKYVASQPALLGVGGGYIYKVYSLITGHTFKNNEAEIFSMLAFIFGLIPYLVLLIYVVKIGELWRLPEKAIVLSLVLFCFGYLGLGYTTIINRHIIAACTLIASFYHTQKMLEKKPSIIQSLMTGFFLGISFYLEIIITFFTVLAFWYALFQNVKLQKLIPAIAVFIGVSFVYLLLQYLKTGQFLPVQLIPGVFRYPGSYWTGEVRGMDRLLKQEFHESKFKYIYHTLFGHHGIISMTPILILGFIGMFKKILKSAKPDIHDYLVISIILTYVLLVVYTRNYGGSNVGFRYFIPSSALILLYMPYCLQSLRKIIYIPIVLLLFYFSITNSFDGLMSGAFRYSKWHQKYWLEQQHQH